MNCLGEEEEVFVNVSGCFIKSNPNPKTISLNVEFA